MPLNCALPLHYFFYTPRNSICVKRDKRYYERRNGLSLTCMRSNPVNMPMPSEPFLAPTCAVLSAMSGSHSTDLAYIDIDAPVIGRAAVHEQLRPTQAG